MKKKILLLFFAVFFAFAPVMRVEAKSLQDMYNSLDKLKAQKKTNDANKNLTNSQISSLKNDITNINASINQTNADIDASNKSIEESKTKITEKTEETKELLRFLQVSTGENVYLEYLFSAEDYTDFIYRYSVITQLSEYNDKLMQELKALVDELEQKKIELAGKQKQLQSQKEELSNKIAILSTSLSSLVKDGSTIDEDITNLKKEINYYESIGCSRYQDISSCVSSPYATGWSYPISYGTVSSEWTGWNLRGDWSGYHHGIDLWNPNINGAPVYSAAAGVVSIKGWISSGGNAVYINHTVNGQQYTTVYMHLSGYGAIEVGSQVTKDTVIGYAGATGDVSGAHLHFGVSYGWRNSGSDFNNNSINPRDILWFSPGLYGGYFYR